MWQISSAFEKNRQSAPHFYHRHESSSHPQLEISRSALPPNTPRPLFLNRSPPPLLTNRPPEWLPSSRAGKDFPVLCGPGISLARRGYAPRRTGFWKLTFCSEPIDAELSKKLADELKLESGMEGGIEIPSTVSDYLENGPFKVIFTLLLEEGSN